MTFSIGIRTVPRKADYCKGTLHRLVEIGALQDSRVLGLHVSFGPELTPNQNGIRALRRASKDAADWIVFMEDDVDVIDDFVGSLERWLAKHESPSVRAYPLVNFYPQSHIYKMRGVWQWPLKDYYGSQCVVMRTRDAVEFSDWLESLALPAERDVSFDLKITQWHVETVPEQSFILTPVPSFVEHTGEFSSIGPPGSWERVGRVPTFPGREWSYVG